MKTNLCFIGLAKKFTDNLCRKLSATFELFYANVEDLIEFELIDIAKMEEVCGKEYLLKEEHSVINRICTYDNTLINIDYKNLNNESNLNTIKDRCLLIYFHLDKERFKKEQEKEDLTLNQKVIENDLFDDRDFICKNIADMTINCTDLSDEEIINVVRDEVLKYFM